MANGVKIRVCLFPGSLSKAAYGIHVLQHICIDLIIFVMELPFTFPNILTLCIFLTTVFDYVQSILCIYVNLDK